MIATQLAVEVGSCAQRLQRVPRLDRIGIALVVLDVDETIKHMQPVPVNKASPRVPKV